MTHSVHQRDLKVMGGRAHVVVHGADDSLLDVAERRLRELESLWSRFVETSDVTRANRLAGLPTPAHPDTLAVVARAVLAWRQTEGRFDITTLPALLEAGYTHSVLTHAAAPSIETAESSAPLRTRRRVGLSALIGVDYEAGTLTVPHGGAIDLGGIGKGMAADIVAEELVEAGATGALVNLGGDLAAVGSPVDAPSWHLGIDDPRSPGSHVATLQVASGGLATSGTTIRRWENPDGTTAHHLIDPLTSRPSAHGLRTATVLAADAATAEVYATSAMMLTPPAAVAMLDQCGLAGLVVADDGHVLTTSTFEAFRV